MDNFDQLFKDTVSKYSRMPVTDEQLTFKEKDLNQHDMCSRLSLLLVMEVT